MPLRSTRIYDHTGSRQWPDSSAKSRWDIAWAARLLHQHARLSRSFRHRLRLDCADIRVKAVSPIARPSSRRPSWRKFIPRGCAFLIGDSRAARSLYARKKPTLALAVLIASWLAAFVLSPPTRRRSLDRSWAICLTAVAQSVSRWARYRQRRRSRILSLIGASEL